ncbi:MAG: hypothetical protein JXN61_05160 [Sedimentisphaerales bacterium]|nr:hypothetical protein [Sedimentisphaerales bacterium]
MPKIKVKCAVRSICLSTLICCLLVGSGLDMAVICHAEDGQTAIEAAAGSGCVKSPPARSDEACKPSTEHEFSSTDHCGDCADVLISIGPAVVVKKTCEVNIASATWNSLAVVTPAVADSAHSLSLPRLVLPPPCFAPLESVVLLI